MPSWALRWCVPFMSRSWCEVQWPVHYQSCSQRLCHGQSCSQRLCHGHGVKSSDQSTVRAVHNVYVTVMMWSPVTSPLSELFTTDVHVTVMVWSPVTSPLSELFTTDVYVTVMTWSPVTSPLSELFTTFSRPARVPMRTKGRHVWLWLTEFSGATPSCFTLSRSTVFTEVSPETGSYVRTHCSRQVLVQRRASAKLLILCKHSLLILTL